MQLKIVNDAQGCPSIQLINAATGETVHTEELGLSEQITIDVPGVADQSGFTFGEVSPAEEAPAAEAGEGEGAGEAETGEGAGESGEAPAGEAGDGAPAGEGEGSSAGA